MDTGTKLIDLAKAKFGDLTEAESRLFETTPNSDITDCSKLEDRSIRPECIKWLCICPEASKRVTHKGLWVEGAHIDAELDLTYAKISFPLFFEKCIFPKGINLINAETRSLYLPATHTGLIWADGLKVEGNVFLRDGFKAEGGMRLLGAIIGGNFDCENSQFINKGKIALDCDSFVVKGRVFLRNGFKAEGEVRLLGATIGGDFDCENGQFINKGKVALNCDDIVVKRRVFLRNGFKAEGEVRLLRATIDGDLDCFNGQFINKGNKALNCDGLTAKNNVFLRKGFKAEGKVDLAGATIERYFIWTGVDSPEKITLDLSSARVGTLLDDPASWPRKGKLDLHGFVYDEIAGGAPRDAETRIDWIQRQGEGQFRPQPYEQLAKVLRETGRYEDVRKINIARERDRGEFTEMSFLARIMHRTYGLILDYGYFKWKPLRWGLALIVLGWFIFGLAFSADLITEIKVMENISESGSEIVRVDSAYPKFNPLVYSIDMFVPLIDLYQAKYWHLNTKLKAEWRPFNLSWFKVPVSGNGLRWYMWIHTGFGWILTTLLVVGLTGLVRT